ncbi:MAG: hypothetical protein MJA84_13850 [Firmicutes bacterium]|nr:hypothetical protein [Bacillota bacterium]
MIKRELTKLEKILIITVIIAGSFYFYLNQVYDPKLNQYQATLEETAQLQQQMTELGKTPGLARISGRVEEKKLALVSLEAELELLREEKKAGSHDVVTLVIDDMNGLAVKNNITLTVLKVSRDEAREEPAPSRKIKAQPPGEEPGARERALALPVSAAEMEWQEYRLEITGGHRNLVGFIGELKDMKRVVVLGTFGVDMNTDTGEYDIVMTVLI